MGLTPLPSAPQSIVSNDVTDVILTGGGGVAAGGAGGGLEIGDLVTNTQTQMLLSQTLDSTNVVGKSVGAAEVLKPPWQPFSRRAVVVEGRLLLSIPPCHHPRSISVS